MSIDKTLNQKNRKDLIMFLIWNIAIIIFLISNPLSAKSFKEYFNELAAKDGIFIIMSPIIIVVVNGILNVGIKHSIVFCRIKNTLPGHRVFTELISKDTRIDKQSLIGKHGELPTSPKEQNRLWYKIYKTYKNNPIILQSHKGFLLTRDMASISFLLLILSPLILITDAQFTNVLILIGYFFIQLAILILVSRNYGNRFCLNVLALDS